jgi:WD40 repeat protein
LKQFYEEKKTKDIARNVLEEKQIEMFAKKDKLTDQDVYELKRAKDNFIAKSQPINPSKYQEHVRHVEVIHKQCHRSWITQIKYYPDIQNLVSSSLDGCIHIHDIGSLSYKEGRTFNLHQKGVNAFVYSAAHKVMASCGEERQIILWNPFTLMAQTYLPGHTTAV